MRVLIACEFSGVVRDAFLAAGHDALSCDLLPSERPGPHYQGDVRDVLDRDWHMLLAFPPCTHLAASGARWWPKKQDAQRDALAFVRLLLDAPIPRIALENPVGAISSHIRKPEQIIQPWWFGHGEIKTTCLWLKNVPPLAPERLAAGRDQRVWRMGESANRACERSRTYPGVAGAMARQWGALQT